MWHYQLISLFDIYVAEEPMHDVLQHVDLFFAKYFKQFGESCQKKEINMQLANRDLSPFLNKGSTIAYLSRTENIPCDNDLLVMFVEGLLICRVYNFIILLDKLPYPDEFLEFSEETVH